MVPCRDCGELVSVVASVCGNCGLEKPWQTPENTVWLIPCRECGKSVRGWANQCGYCGAEHPATSAWWLKWSRIVVWILAAIFLIGILFAP